MFAVFESKLISDRIDCCNEQCFLQNPCLFSRCYNFYKRMTGTSGVMEQTFYDHNTNVGMKVKQSQNHTIIYGAE